MDCLLEVESINKILEETVALFMAKGGKSSSITQQSTTYTKTKADQRKNMGKSEFVETKRKPQMRG